MAPSAVRFVFLAFALLTGAMATNIFVFQPPGRQLTASAPVQGAAPLGASGWTSRHEPAPVVSSASKTEAVVPPIETGAVMPIPETADRSDLVRAIQRELKGKGYEVGAIDG